MAGHWQQHITIQSAQSNNNKNKLDTHFMESIVTMLSSMCYEMKIWTSPASLSDAFLCLPAALAASSLLRASSRAFTASDFTAEWPGFDLPAAEITQHTHSTKNQAPDFQNFLRFL